MTCLISAPWFDVDVNVGVVMFVVTAFLFGVTCKSTSASSMHVTILKPDIGCLFLLVA